MSPWGISGHTAEGKCSTGEGRPMRGHWCAAQSGNDGVLSLQSDKLQSGLCWPPFFFFYCQNITSKKTFSQKTLNLRTPGIPSLFSHIILLAAFSGCSVLYKPCVEHYSMLKTPESASFQSVVAQFFGSILNQIRKWPGEGQTRSASSPLAAWSSTLPPAQALKWHIQTH